MLAQIEAEQEWSREEQEAIEAERELEREEREAADAKAIAEHEEVRFVHLNQTKLVLLHMYYLYLESESVVPL